MKLLASMVSTVLSVTNVADSADQNAGNVNVAAEAGMQTANVEDPEYNGNQMYGAEDAYVQPRYQQ